MTKIKLLIRKIKLAFAITLVNLFFTQVQAQTAQPVILVQRPGSIFNQPPSPPPLPTGTGQPGNRSETAGRGGCEDTNNQLTPSKEKVLTALVPIYGSADSGLVWALTTAENPTFWFYVPDQLPLPGEFILFDQGEQVIYKTKFKLSGKPGFVNLSLPSKAAKLEIGKQYHWFFKIYCKSGKPPALAQGWIQRNSLKPAIKSQLEKATLLQERVNLYAKQGIWYEALSAAAELRVTDPTYWAALLHSVGLDNLASEPIIECCKPEN